MTGTLRVAVVGGGIGGAAAALALHQGGVHVDIYERAASVTPVGAGLAMHPNGARMLRRLGLGAHLDAVGARWVDAKFHHSDGSVIASWWPATGDIEAFTLHRADIHQMLLAGLPPERMHVNRRCVGFGQDDTHAWVDFASGDRAVADIVIGADGTHSALLGEVVAEAPLRGSGRRAYFGSVDAADVPWPVEGFRSFLGPNCHFLTYPMRAHQLVGFVGFVPATAQERWRRSGHGDVDALRAAFAGWDERVAQVLRPVESCYWTEPADRAPLPQWSRGRLALIGDAAHAMLPHVGQGATQAIEDAVTLGILLGASDASSAPAALVQYHEIRRERTARVQEMARSNGSVYESEDLDSRNERLAHQARDRAWMWDHDAGQAAEDALGAVR